MKRTFSLRFLYSAIVVGALLFLSAGTARAQAGPPPPPPPGTPPPITPPVTPTPMQFQPQLPPLLPPVDTTGRMKIFLTGAFGFGFDSTDVGTARGDTVSISGGGGAGLAVGFGFGIAPGMDLDFDLGGQVSVLTPAVTNADGSFTRGYLLATFKQKLPISETGQFKFGIGLGAYSNGEMDIDTRDAGGFHDIIKYDDALGVHVTGEFERFIAPSTSVNFGAKIYFVKYKAKSWTRNGVTTPSDSLPSDRKDLNGNGMDFMIGIIQYF